MGQFCLRRGIGHLSTTSAWPRHVRAVKSDGANTQSVRVGCGVTSAKGNCRKVYVQWKLLKRSHFGENFIVACHAVLGVIFVVCLRRRIQSSSSPSISTPMMSGLMTTPMTRGLMRIRNANLSAHPVARAVLGRTRIFSLLCVTHTRGIIPPSPRDLWHGTCL